MNEFVTMLNNFIENSGISQSQISRDVNISRTKLNKCLNGKRNLTYQELDQICKYLSLSSFQESVLKQAFTNRDLTGLQHRNFAELDNLFPNIHEVKKIDCNQMIIHPRNQIEISQGHYFGRLNVITMIKKIIRAHYDLKHKADLVMNLPLYDNLLRQFFIEILCNFNSNFQITHLIPINHEDSMVNEEFNVLNVLNQVVPLAMLGHYRYNSWYFDAYLLKNEFNIYPYFIIVNNVALFVSGDLKNLMVDKNGEAIRYYTKVSELQKLASKPLVRQTSEVPDLDYDIIFSDERAVRETYRAAKMVSIREAKEIYRKNTKLPYNDGSRNTHEGISIFFKDDLLVIKLNDNRSDCLMIENRNLINSFKDYIRANITANI